MAKIKYSPGIEYVTGAFSKQGIVQRQKHFHGPKGEVTKTARVEAYIIQNPRDFKRKPASGAELKHQTAFGEASRQANALLKAAKNGSATPEQMTIYDQMVKRFYAQKEGKPDASIPVDAHGNAKIYGAFNCFVRSVFYYDLLAQQS
ncbi:MAG: hypothetical protein II928_04530 [Paludibacteraceae bacterium]|nr:hypothetical protein [Paludibacteraceae bacterium]